MFVILYVMMMTLLARLLAEIGLAIGLVLSPAFLVGFMVICRSCARRQPPPLPDLFAGFRSGFGAQLALGAGYLILLAVTLWATSLADDGALAKWFLTGEQPAVEIVRSPEFRNALLVFAAVLAPFMMLYMFAPVLVAWHGMSVAKAMFFSFVACLVNWRAFTGYGIAGLLLIVGLSLAVLTTMVALFGVAVGAVRADQLMRLLVLVLMPVMFGSFYASYRDVFGTPAPPPVEPAPH